MIIPSLKQPVEMALHIHCGRTEAQDTTNYSSLGHKFDTLTL